MALTVCWSGIATASLSVFTCEPEWKALVEELGGGHVEVYSATTGMQDPHYIEARPSLISKARKADMLVCTGAELEIGWLPVVQRRSGNSRLHEGSESVFYSSEFVNRLEIPDSTDRAKGDVHASGNPHVHLDPHRLLEIAEQLTKRMMAIDSTHAKSYEQNFKVFSDRWLRAITEWEAQMSPFRGTQVIVHHRSWSYLFDWLGWKSIAELEPVPGSPPTTRHLSTLMEVVEQKKPSMIVLATFQDPRGARWLSDRTGLPEVSLPFTIGGSEDVDNLHSLFEEILNRLTHAISRQVE